MGNFGGHHWDRAADTGRIRPGRGPYYTRRVLPTTVPVLRRAALEEGVPRRALDRWRKVVRGVLLPPPENDRTDRLGPRGHHGDPAPYLLDIVTRIRTLWLLTPCVVVCGWGAAAIHGLIYWADSEPVMFFSRRTRRSGSAPHLPVFRDQPEDVLTCRPDPSFPAMQVVDPATAAAQCLATIMKRTKTWWVPDVPGLEPRQVRAVQFIDAFLQCTELTKEEIRDGARHRVGRRSLEELLGLSDYGAQSPMETVLRLIVRDMLPAGHRWTSQVEVQRKRPGETTTPDLACRTLKVALYYDGAHHDGAAQTDTDFRLFQELKDLGWEPVRVNKGLLADREEFLGQLASAIARATASHS